jgi:hypothetical protein
MSDLFPAISFFKIIHVVGSLSFEKYCKILCLGQSSQTLLVLFLAGGWSCEYSESERKSESKVSTSSKERLCERISVMNR